MSNKIEYKYNNIAQILNKKLNDKRDKNDIDSAVLTCIDEFNKDNKYSYIINYLFEYYKQKEILFYNHDICPNIHMLISWDTIYWQVTEIYYTYEKSEIQSYQTRLIDLLSEIFLYCYKLNVLGEKIPLDINNSKNLHTWNDKTIANIINKNKFNGYEDLDLLWKDIDEYKVLLSKLMKIKYYLKSKLKEQK